MTKTYDIHPFEKAGLGRAPFRIIGVEERRGPMPLLDEDGNWNGSSYVGSPGQPMGCCKLCYTGIAECWIIRSADGKIFDVGCECVRKTGAKVEGFDEKLRELKKEKRRLQKAREEERIAGLERRLTEDQGLRDRLQSLPHPHPNVRGTLLDSALWMMQHAGHAGKIKTVRLVERTEKGDRS